MTMAVSDRHRVASLLIGGTVGGMMQAIVGHPLDTLKVRLQQRNSQFKGPLDCFRQTLRSEGALGLYKGVSSPFFMAGFLNAAMFAINGTCKMVVAKASNTTVPELSMLQVTIAAWMNAPFYGLVLAPVDVVKSRLQIQRDASSSLYTGPFDCVTKTVRRDGLRGLFRGYFATVGSRLLGSPAYFCTYELLRREFVERNEGQLFSRHYIVSGSFAGIAFWAVSFPVDSLKTRMQTQTRNNDSSGKGEILRHIKQMYQEGGVRGFYRGIAPCLLRAAPANAVVFLGLEWVQKLMGVT